MFPCFRYNQHKLDYNRVKSCKFETKADRSPVNSQVVIDSTFKKSRHITATSK